MLRACAKNQHARVTGKSLFARTRKRARKVPITCSRRSKLTFAGAGFCRTYEGTDGRVKLDRLAYERRRNEAGHSVVCAFDASTSKHAPCTRSRTQSRDVGGSKQLGPKGLGRCERWREQGTSPSRGKTYLPDVVGSANRTTSPMRRPASLERRKLGRKLAANCRMGTVRRRGKSGPLASAQRSTLPSRVASSTRVESLLG